MELTLDQVRGMLRTNKHRLDDELEIQPEMMQRIAEQVVLHNSKMLEAKDDLARTEARLTDDIKEEDPKLAKDYVDGKVRRHAERTRAWERFQLARSKHESWACMLESWRQKGYSLKTLAELHGAQYFSANSASSAADRQAEREGLYHEGRRQQAEHRHRERSVPDHGAEAVGMDERDAPRTRRREIR